MKKAFVLLSLLLFILVNIRSQKPEYFVPYQNTSLRLPAVPIVVNDPYFSIWSPYDKLNEGVTCHWTGMQKPITGLLRVDGTTYCFMGDLPGRVVALLPTARDTVWEAPCAENVKDESWTKLNFDDSSWKVVKGALGSKDNIYNHTNWSEEKTERYVRRTVELTKEDIESNLRLLYSHDDIFEIFINGTRIFNTGNVWKSDQVYVLSEKDKKALRVGKNVIAAHCSNTIGGAELDYGLYKNEIINKANVKKAEQKSVSVLATNTYYTMQCGPVMLDLVFTAPMLIDDYDLLSTPINYISYQVRSIDKKAHSVQFYMDVTPEMANNKNTLSTISSIEKNQGVSYLKSGTIDQPILAKKGDGICIDWGYVYLPAFGGEVSLGNNIDMQINFAQQGKLLATQTQVISNNSSEMQALAYLHDFGTINSGDTPSSFTMLGYDEIYDIEYLYKRYKSYWAHQGKISIFDAFTNLKCGYDAIMQRCRQFDKRIYDDGLNAGDKQYAEILSASYRHVMAAHKLFVNDEGKLFFFSKENNSNGSVNTVDLTYPEAPLFLLYNPELQKAMMTSILDYALSKRWTKPFAAHDMGTYPIADGQTYGGDMPIEESGNMLTLAATICQIEGNPSYVAPYWDILTRWADYLVENGQDPSNQLCTDDFAGHWAHNCNLSIKAILGILAYSRLAGMRGETAVCKKYEEKAREMAKKWETDARDGDHYRLAFDRPDTWSQKYNLIWDKLWKTHIFSDAVLEREIAYYLTKQNVYGLPLDCRRDYTKSDWIMWTAAMSTDTPTFLRFVSPLYKYINETPSRVAISDWHDTKTARYQAFIARSVIGGYWMKVLMDKMLKG